MWPTGCFVRSVRTATGIEVGGIRALCVGMSGLVLLCGMAAVAAAQTREQVSEPIVVQSSASVTESNAAVLERAALRAASGGTPTRPAYYKRRMRPGDTHEPIVPFPAEWERAAPGTLEGPESPPGGSSAGPDGPVGVTFQANNDTGSFPPDPSLAAGPSELISVVNTSMDIYDKFGNRLFRAELDDFFSRLQGQRSVEWNFPFDPRAVYHQYLKRFVVVIIAANITQGGFDKTYLLLGVSKSSSAVSGDDALWHKFAIEISTDSHWSDYPMIGYDEEYLYLCYNMFPKSAGGLFTRQHLIDLRPVLDPINPPPGLPSRFFDNIQTATGQGAFSVQPAHSFGPTQSGWYASIDFGFGSSSTVNLFARDGGGSVNLLRSFAVIVPQYVPAGAASQRDSATALDTLGDRMMHAVWRDNSLWCTHTVNGPNGPAVRWYEFDTSNFPAAPTLKQSGDVTAGPGGVAGDFHNFVPAIMVDAAGDMLVTFTSAGRAAYPSLCYAHREATDPPGATRPPTLVVPGTRPYDGAGFGFERWGDYCGNALDPEDEATFWMLHELAGTSSALWQCWIGSATLNLAGGGGGGPPSPPVPTTLQMVNPNGSETLVAGLPTYRIIWGATGIPTAPVNLALFRQLGNQNTRVGTIKSNLQAADGAYDWEVGLLEDGTRVSGGTNYIVRVEAANDQRIFDDSDYFFRILDRVTLTAGALDPGGVPQSEATFAPEESVQLLAAASKGLPPYFFSWSPQDFLNNPNIANPVARPTRSVRYTVKVRDGTGTEATTSVNLVLGNPLRVDAGPSKLFAAGGNVLLEGSAAGGVLPYTAEWFTCDPTGPGCSGPPVAAGVQPFVTPPGTATIYFLRVTDGAGTVRTDNVLIEPGFGLTIENDPGNGGTVARSPLQSLYRPTDLVTFTANAAPGYVFDHWETGGSGKANPLQLSFPNQNLVIRAVYTSTQPPAPTTPTTQPPPAGSPTFTLCAPAAGMTTMMTAGLLLTFRIARRRRRE